MLKYPERDSSEESADPSNSTTNKADEGNLNQAEKFVRSSIQFAQKETKS